MKTIFALLVVVAFTCNVNADNEYLQYEYDAAGNRIGRTVVQSQPNQAPKRNLLTADITVFPTITSDNVTISIALDAAGPSDHDYHRVEQDANIRAFKYFLKNESGFDYQNNWSPKNPIDDNEWLSKIIGLRQSYANRNDISHNLIDNQKNSLESIIPFVKQLSIYQ